MRPSLAVMRPLLLALLVVWTVAPRIARAHPLHTTLATLSYDAATRTVTVSLRVFADDFVAAVTNTPPRRDPALPPDSVMARYVMPRFTVARAPGRAVALKWCGAKRVGETLLLCLRGTDAAGLPGMRVLSTLLREHFDDQVNMVQATYGGRRHMLLFTKRDDARALP